MVILLLQAIIGLVIKHYCKCLSNVALCRRCRSYNARETVVAGGLRILLTGFLEILLCTIIGVGIFKLDSFTNVDVATIIVTVLYQVTLVCFCALLLWFIFVRSRPLAKIKNDRDQLEHLKILKIISNKDNVATDETIKRQKT